MLQFRVLLRAWPEAPEGTSDRLADLVHRRLTMERMLLTGAALLFAGLGIGLAILVKWAASGFGELSQLRAAIAPMTLFVLGTQTIFGAFLYARSSYP